jgi:hypothetical protein
LIIEQLVIGAGISDVVWADSYFGFNVLDLWRGISSDLTFWEGRLTLSTVVAMIAVSCWYVSDKSFFAFNGPKSSFADDADVVRWVVMWGKGTGNHEANNYFSARTALST